jgi:DNA topoisomerase-1
MGWTVLSKTLVIVESPAKAKTISKFLGKKYFVKASMGHVRDLPKSQFGVDVQNGFNPKYITIRGKGDTIKDLRAAVKKSDKVLIASDPDREGEAIAWHLQNLLNICDDKPCRIEFNEITKQAIQNAVKHPRPIDNNRVNAQQARRILDRLVGYNLSPLLWRKVKKGLSAGRVQSVAVRLIADREEEIQAFVPEEYWTLTGSFVKTGHAPFEGKLHHYKDKKIEIKTEGQMQEVLDNLKGLHYTVAKVTRKEKSRRPASPFITSTLQQEAYRKLNFTARKTMIVAQQLYEGLDLGKEGTSGLLTYIRTDSVRVSDTARDETRAYIQDRFGLPFVSKVSARPPVKGKIQDAHEAIRPTSISREPDQIKQYLSNEQYKLYKLIWSRFLASQMSPAIFDTTSIDIRAGDYLFRAVGSILKFPGYLKVYTESRDDGEKDEDKLLPEVKEGEVVEARSLTEKQHFTQPPPRYTDATLVKTLEEKGIGRPSTYAPIVETVIKRGYIVRENKQLYPTELGVIVVDLLKKHFKDIIDVTFTAGMEEKLDSIEEGDLDWVKVLDSFYDPFMGTLEKAEDEIGQVQVADEVTEEVCELCGRNLVIKMGRFGKFLACPGFPDCRNTKPLLEPTGVLCPRCEGEIVIRRSKKGRKFYGCSRYPDCDFVTWDRPSKTRCPECGDLMVEKKSAGKNQSLKCINQNCSSNQGSSGKKSSSKRIEPEETEKGNFLTTR